MELSGICEIKYGILFTTGGKTVLLAFWTWNSFFIMFMMLCTLFFEMYSLA